MSSTKNTIAINWLYTVIGGFLAYVSLLSIYRISRPEDGLDISFPLFGKLSYMATLIFSVPALCIGSIVITYLCFIYMNRLKFAPKSFFSCLPKAFNEHLGNDFITLQYFLFFLFAISPIVISCVTFERLFEQEMYDLDHRVRIGGWQIFSFQEGFYDGDRWRWSSHTPDEKLSAYPGIQPIVYVLLISGAALFLTGFFVQARSLIKKR